MMSRVLVLYHKNCSDGFCAAWVARKAYPYAEFIPVSYQDPIPDVAGRDVIIADFSYKREALEQMKAKATTLRVYDHHKTAEEDLRDLEYCIFDMDRSGAKLVWDYLYRSPFAITSEATPWLVDYTEDRDLWRFKLPHSKEISAALQSYPFDFEIWDRLEKRDINDMIIEGSAILRYQQRLIGSLKQNVIEVEIKGYKVPSLNSSVLQSELGNELAQGRPFAAIWYQDKEGCKYSLRSTKEGIDVSEVAKSYGGGGHRSSAGFMVKENNLL